MSTSVSILLVDHDAEDRKLFLESLQEIDPDINCHIANNGKEALSLLTVNTQQLPGYIFLELNTPEIDGRQCLQQIKQHHSLKNIPVIIYTRSGSADEANELQSLGAAHFVTKPANPGEIYYLLSVVLQEIPPYQLSSS